MDLRKPSGYFFAIVGVILLVLGALRPDNRAPLLEINLNLYMGAFLLLFGGTFLWLSRKS